MQGVAGTLLVEQVKVAPDWQIRRSADTHLDAPRGAGAGHPAPGRGQQLVTDLVQPALIEGE